MTKQIFTLTLQTRTVNMSGELRGEFYNDSVLQKVAQSLIAAGFCVEVTGEPESINAVDPSAQPQERGERAPESSDALSPLGCPREAPPEDQGVARLRSPHVEEVLAKWRQTAMLLCPEMQQPSEGWNTRQHIERPAGAMLHSVLNELEAALAGFPPGVPPAHSESKKK